MNRILEREALNPTVTRLKVEAPLIARKAEPGQFVILRTDGDGERIPLTVADFDREEGTRHRDLSGGGRNDGKTEPSQARAIGSTTS